MKILIVEDDRWFAEACADMLSPEHDVTVCHDAQTGIEAADTSRPDAVLLDIMLPGGNGFAFLQELRSYDDMAVAPVVVCSGVRLNAGQQRALSHFGPLKLLTKTDLTPERLRAVIKQCEALDAAKH